MTLEEAFALMLDPKTRMAYTAEDVPDVTIERNGSSWTGKIVGVVTVPSLILETPATRVAIGLNGASLAPRDKEQS